MTGLNLNYEPEIVVDIRGLTREEWLDYRKKGIGGRDVKKLVAVMWRLLWESPHLRQSGIYITTRWVSCLLFRRKKKVTGLQRKSDIGWKILSQKFLSERQG